MRVVIQENYDKMCKWAADYMLPKLNNIMVQSSLVMKQPVVS